MIIYSGSTSPSDTTNTCTFAERWSPYSVGLWFRVGLFEVAPLMHKKFVSVVLLGRNVTHTVLEENNEHEDIIKRVSGNFQKHLPLRGRRLHFGKGYGETCVKLETSSCKLDVPSEPRNFRIF
jgi:hypothetical protein